MTTLGNEKYIWNPYLEGYFQEPRDFLRKWRTTYPAHKGINGDWFFFKYEDVKFLLTSSRFKTWKTHQAVNAANRNLKNSGNLKELTTIFSSVLLFQDAPAHPELRSVIAKVWNTYSPQEFIEVAIQDSLASFTKKEQTDLVADYARAVPTKIISKILGLPAVDYAQISHWSYQFIAALEPFVSLHQLQHYNKEAAAFHEYLSKEIARKERQPDELFISRFLAVNKTLAKPLSRNEIISILCMLFFAGIETSVNLLSQSILELIKNPDQAAIVRQTEQLPAIAANELIRYISPVNYTKRTVIEDIEIRGCQIRAGESVFGSLISANFDEEFFDKPERLDLMRAVNPHLGFGHGSHFCLGARLGREQISRSIPALFRRYPNMTLTQVKNNEWEKLIMNRALKTLPVNLYG